MADKDTTIDASTEQWFTEFYENHCEIIFYLVSRRNTGSFETEDIMQEVLLRLIRYCDTLQKIVETSPGHLMSYLASTVNSVYVDQFRITKSKMVPLPEKELLRQVTEQRMHESFQQTSNQQAVEFLRKNLPKRDWILLKGKYWDGLSHLELATQTGYSYGSVRMALSRAKKNARKLLEDWEGDLL